MSTELAQYIFTTCSIQRHYQYLIELEDWYSLIFVSKEVMFAVKKYFIYSFILDDQWVFCNVKAHGQHALYHANNRRRFELTFREVGYSPTADDCSQCGKHDTLQTPLAHALEFSADRHLELIRDKGYSKLDGNCWELLRSAIRSLDNIMVKYVVDMFRSVEISDCEILSLSSNMPDAIVEQCISFALTSMKIDVNVIDEYGSTILFHTLHSEKALDYLREKGIDMRHRNIFDENIVDATIGSINRHMMDVIRPDYLRVARLELLKFADYREFSDYRNAIYDTVFQIDSILTLMGEAV